MRTNGYDYEDFRTRFFEIIESLGRYSQSEPLEAALKFIDAIDETKGIAQPNAGWNDDANVRGPYQTTIPGMIAEVIAMTNLAPRGSNKAIKNAYEKHSQVDLKIDFWIDDLSYQSKTVRFIGPSVLIESYFVEGQPDNICLIDIDDKICIVVPRTVLEQFVGKRVTKWDFDQMGAQVFDNTGMF